MVTKLKNEWPDFGLGVAYLTWNNRKTRQFSFVLFCWNLTFTFDNS